jgi:hypothetical protein
LSFFFCYAIVHVCYYSCYFYLLGFVELHENNFQPHSSFVNLHSLGMFPGRFN